jgi:hypothetical protein
VRRVEEFDTPDESVWPPGKFCENSGGRDVDAAAAGGSEPPDDSTLATVTAGEGPVLLLRD